MQPQIGSCGAEIQSRCQGAAFDLHHLVERKVKSKTEWFGNEWSGLESFVGPNWRLAQGAQLPESPSETSNRWICGLSKGSFFLCERSLTLSNPFPTVWERENNRDKDGERLKRKKIRERVQERVWGTKSRRARGRGVERQRWKRCFHFSHCVLGGVARELKPSCLKILNC